MPVRPGSNAAAAPAGPAADGPTIASATSTTAGAAATFTSDGDRLVVCDTEADGFGALAEPSWYDYTGRVNRADGAGDCSTATGNIAEGTPVAVRVCLVKNGARHLCDTWRHTTA